MNDRWERLIDLYHSAVSLPADERATLLAEECGDDPALRAEVDRMIAAHHRVYRPTGTVPAIASAAPAATHDADRAASPAAEAATRPGGGAGGRDSTVTPGSVVTEPPDGEAIDAYADGRQMSIAERLELFVQVCNAVANARRRGMSYGELTPASILITPGGAPKLPEFGLGDDGPTPATDVRSLGIVLDRLLGGGTPAGGRRALRPELETIAVTALRTEGWRYESAEALADDVRRYLDAPAAPRRQDKRPPRPGRSPRSRVGAIVAWTLAGVTVTALGVVVLRLAPEPAPVPVAVVPQPEAPAAPARVIVRDLADGVGDSQLTATLSDALRAGLTESPSAALVPDGSRRVDAEVTGTITRAPDGTYTITAQLAKGNAGSPTTSVEETARDSTDVVQALSRLSVRLRQQLGESPTSIAVTPRLEDVTSPSLPALRAFANGSNAIRAGDRARGIRWLRSAVALDTGFASAHRLLGAAYRDASDRARAREAIDHSIANQARLPFYERNHTIATYALNVAGGYATAIDAYNRILARDPRDARVLVSLGAVHAARREYAVQESLLVRAVAVDPNVPSLHTGLATAALNQGRYDDAGRLLDEAERRFPGLRGTQLARIALAASRRDWESAEREARALVARAATDSVDALDAPAALGAILMAQGRLAEAEQQLRRVVALGTRRRAGGRAYAATLDLAYLELRYRQSSSAALATVNGTLTRLPLARLESESRPYETVARLFADAGQPARAGDLMAQAGRLTNRRGSDADSRWTNGAIAMAARRAWEGEIEIRGAADTHPCPICVLPDLARAYEVSGKPDSAIATYERYLRTPWQRRFETDAVELGFAMKRLGELYQQQNDRAKAAVQYAALLQLWRGADTELAPVLADVRRRLDQTESKKPTP